MERETAELLDKILDYLDKKNIRKPWLEILSDLEINVENDKTLFRHLKLKDFITERIITGNSKTVVYISEKGKIFINTSSFAHLAEKEKEENELKKLQTENLTLQNTLLELQTKQQRRYILYSVISFIMGAIVTNGKDILQFLQSAFRE